MERKDVSGHVNPDQGQVEVGSNPTTHPLRRSRIRIPTAFEIAATTDSTGNLVIDPVVFRSVSRMDAGE